LLSCHRHQFSVWRFRHTHQQ